MTDKKLHFLAPVCIILAAVFWGFLFVFVRRFTALGFSSLEIVALRCTGSAIWLWLYVYFFERHNETASEPNIALRLADVWCFLGSGLVSIVFFSWCYFKNVAISSAAFAAVLMYTSPIFVLLISALLFHERITRIKAAALFIAIIGSSLVSGITPLSFSSNESISLLGILLGLGSGIGYALYSIFGRLALERGYRPMIVTAWTFLFAALGTLLLINSNALFSQIFAAGSLIFLWLAMGLFGSCLPFSLYTVGLKHMEPGRAAVLATLEPIITTLAGIFLYDESLNFTEAVGIILVLSAGVLITRK